MLKEKGVEHTKEPWDMDECHDAGGAPEALNEPQGYWDKDWLGRDVFWRGEGYFGQQLELVNEFPRDHQGYKK